MNNFFGLKSYFNQTLEKIEPDKKVTSESETVRRKKVSEKALLRVVLLGRCCMHGCPDFSFSLSID